MSSVWLPTSPPGHVVAPGVPTHHQPHAHEPKHRRAVAIFQRVHLTRHVQLPRQLYSGDWGKRTKETERGNENKHELKGDIERSRMYACNVHV